MLLIWVRVFPWCWRMTGNVLIKGVWRGEDATANAKIYHKTSSRQATSYYNNITVVYV